MARCFIDTNVFFYSIDYNEPRKQERARHIIDAAADSGEGVVSSQVIQEFAFNAVKKLGASPRIADQLCNCFLDHTLIKSDLDLVRLALSLMDEASISFWDACIVAAASLADCRVIYTEDLSHGRLIGRVKVINPFLAD